EEMKICYIDGIEKKLENKELDFVSVVDIVIAPVEEENKTKLDQIQEIVNSIDPKMVVVIGEKKDEAEKVFGAMEKIDVLKISKTNLPEEGRQIIALG
ncbi:MAG: MBL fold metallo-hydrolase, partial [Patescibacteria group bacterium]